MPDGHRRNFWAVETTGDMVEDTHLGYFYAAAYLRYLQLNDAHATDAILGWIVRDMPAHRGSNAPHIAIAFFSGLHRYLHAFAALMPGQRVASDIELVTQIHRAVHAKYVATTC